MGNYENLTHSTHLSLDITTHLAYIADIATKAGKGKSTPMHDEYTIGEARDHFAELINKVAYGGERIVLTRHGKKIAAIVPLLDLELLIELEQNWAGKVGSFRQQDCKSCP